jgi:hypothetical protein
VSILAPAAILAELEKLANRLGVAVRFEPLLGAGAGSVGRGSSIGTTSIARGGLCRLRGTPFILIDGGLPIMDKIGILSEALSTFDLAAIYLPPVLRSRLEKKRSGRGPVRPPLRPMAKARRRDVRG